MSASGRLAGLLEHHEVGAYLDSGRPPDRLLALAANPKALQEAWKASIARTHASWSRKAILQLHLTDRIDALLRPGPAWQPMRPARPVVPSLAVAKPVAKPEARLDAPEPAWAQGLMQKLDKVLAMPENKPAAPIAVSSAAGIAVSELAHGLLALVQSSEALTAQNAELVAELATRPAPTPTQLDGPIVVSERDGNGRWEHLTGPGFDARVTGRDGAGKARRVQVDSNGKRVVLTLERDGNGQVVRYHNAAAESQTSTWTH